EPMNGPAIKSVADELVSALGKLEAAPVESKAHWKGGTVLLIVAGVFPLVAAVISLAMPGALATCGVPWAPPTALLLGAAISWSVAQRLLATARARDDKREARKRAEATLGLVSKLAQSAD